MNPEEFNSENSEEEVETMTSAEVVAILEESWLNEKFSPELLPEKTEIVDCILQQLHEMENNILRARKGDFKICIHRKEIERIRYMLVSYLRIRLQKIEKYAAYLMEEEKTRRLLSKAELKFATEYLGSLEHHFHNVALAQMPPNLQQLDTKNTGVKPDVDTHVFLRVNKDVDGVLVEQTATDNREEIVHMETGDQHLMRYRPIASLLHDNSVSLI